MGVAPRQPARSTNTSGKQSRAVKKSCRTNDICTHSSGQSFSQAAGLRIPAAEFSSSARLFSFSV